MKNDKKSIPEWIKEIKAETLDKFAEEVRKLDLNCGGGCCQANGELNEGVNKLLEKHKQ